MSGVSVKSDEAMLSSASTTGSVGALSEFTALFRAARIAAARAETDIEKECVSTYDPARDIILRLLGRPLDDCRALEIGPGQWLAQARYFGRWARVTGIDLDLLPTGFNVGAYIKMWRTNGSRRAIKTMARKALGIDRRIIAAYEHKLGKAKYQPVLRQMDATATDFPDGHFDFAYSFNVLEHIPGPERVFRECARVVKPGGVVLHDIHLYTSDSGCHDARIISNQRGDLPYWPHLYPASAGRVLYGGYLNKLTLAQWHAAANAELPGCEISYRRDEYPLPHLKAVRSKGELSTYSDDELMVRNVMVAWKKPA
jgi:SAM-dependent methyltransferase